MQLAGLPAVQRLIEMALEEDLGRGDVTTASVLDGRGGEVEANLVARQDLVLFGMDVAAAVFARVDGYTDVDVLARPGAEVEAGAVVATVEGWADSVLMAERTALNFVQRLSGVATLARRYARAVEGTGARVVDTRKTTPGYRALEKAAVLAGGCFNHRFDLGSGVLVKDNHIAACGSVRAAVERARARAPHSLRVEVEVADLAQLDVVAQAVERARDRGALVEVSGGVTLDTVGDIARTGVDLISVGALTHSAPSVDLALDFA